MIFRRRAHRATAWDVTALLNAADPRAPQAERHLWLVRLMEWLRHAPSARRTARIAPKVRLVYLLDLLDRHAEHRAAVQGLLLAFVRDIDAVALFADFGYSHRMALRSALWQRLRHRLLPGTPATADLGLLFPLLFDGHDAGWLGELDDALLARIALLAFPPEAAQRWRVALVEALGVLVGAVQAAGVSSPMRQRMTPALLADRPFQQMAATAEQLRAALDADDAAAGLRAAAYLRALLDGGRRATDSIASHLEAHGVSIDIVFEADQLRERSHRAERVLDCLLAPQPARDALRLVQHLAEVAGEQRGMRRLFARHSSQLARRVVERSAETGQHYITRDRAEYADMLRRAAGGGAVLAATTFVKFAVLAIGLSAFWAGFAAGINYAASFVRIMLAHWTVATKQPAMTAPALAARLARVRHAVDTPDRDDDVAAIESFVDEVAHLIRSQAAGIFGNLAMCAPLVLGVQWLARWCFDAPLIGTRDAQHALDTLTLLGPTPLYAAFTGVLLFASSLIAGWCDNGFVFHRLEGAIAWNPRIVARVGAARAQRWAAWWRQNVSGVAANVSLGMMLGLVPAVAGFFGLPLEVRHVTLSTGQVAAALGTFGFGLLAEPRFWWCVAGIAATGFLNLTVSFSLAFRIAVRAHGIRLGERKRLYSAIRHRLARRPASFLFPPR